MRRPRAITPEQFIALLRAKRIRPASLQDVEGLHHKRPLYLHPNTKQPWVEVPVNPAERSPK